MTKQELLHLRIQNQLLINPTCKTAGEVLSRMGALQAQNYASAQWAIGCRMAQSTLAEIEEAFNKNEILRTHILRPTWHFVSPKDIRWMLNLTAPRIKAIEKSQHRKLEIDRSVLNKSRRILEKSMEGKRLQSRKEIKLLFEKEKIATHELRLSYLLADAELDGIICSAGRKDKQFCYGLLEEIVPPSPNLSHNEALKELSLRYFNSRGPASLKDFSWWSGLTLKDARTAIHLNEKQLNSVKVNEVEYFYQELPGLPEKGNLLLLPSFDEYIISYKDRSAVLKPTHQKKVITNNGIFRPSLIKNGKAIATWDKTIKQNHLSIKINHFEQEIDQNDILHSKSRQKYSQFLGLTKTEIR